MFNSPATWAIVRSDWMTNCTASALNCALNLRLDVPAMSSILSHEDCPTSLVHPNPRLGGGGGHGVIVRRKMVSDASKCTVHLLRQFAEGGLLLLGDAEIGRAHV